MRDLQLFCSHMISVVATLAMMQVDDTPFAEIVELLPDPIESLQGMAVPLKFVLDTIRKPRKASQKKKESY